MFNLLSKLSSQASHITYYIAENSAQLSSSLLVTASRASDYALYLFPSYSNEIWTLGQGSLMTACGIATIAKASGRWRYPAIAGGLCMVGVGIYAIIDSLGKLCGGTSNESLYHRQLISLQTNSSTIHQKPTCLPRNASHLFEQTCDMKKYKQILVMCHTADGNGDIVHCKKMFEFLEGSFPQHRVDIGFPEDVKPTLEKYFPREFSEKSTYFPSYSNSTTRKDDLVVDCPLMAENYLNEVIAAASKTKTPHIFVMEFDYHTVLPTLELKMKGHRDAHIEFFSSGLHTRSIGIPFNATRYRDSANTGMDELKRLKHLADVSPGMQQAILGKAYSQEAIVNFHKKYSLYPSYTQFSSAKDAFFLTILKTSQLLGETREPCFVFIGRPLTPFANQSTIPVNGWRMFFDMQQLGFNRIEHFSSTYRRFDVFSLRQWHFNNVQNATRSMRMISIPYTPHQNLLTLMSAGRLGQATGDLSAAEMFEAHLPFIYELLVHKREFAKTVAERAREIDPELGEIMKDLMTLYNKEFIKQDLKTYKNYTFIEEIWPKGLTTKGAVALKRLMERPDLWNQLIKHLFEKHNEFTKIREVVQKYLR